MTASRLGLAILTAIAVALALVVALEPPKLALVTARPLVPGLEVDAVVRLVVRGPDSAVELARSDGAWAVTAPAPGPADGPAVADLLSALAVARWDRTVRDPDRAATGLASPRRTVEVTTAGRTTRIAIGAAAATGQVWVQVDAGPPLLVPGWVATAVDRDLGALRQRRLAPVAPAAVTAVELHGPGLDLVLSGAPLTIRGDGWTARAAPDRVTALLAAMTGLAATGFPAADAAPGPEGLSIRILGGAAAVELVERGTCEGGRVRVDGSAGATCVEAAAWHAIRDAASGAGTAAWVDPRPVAGAVSLALARTGVMLRRQGGAFTVEAGGSPAPADADAAARLLAVLAAPARVVAAPAAGGDVIATAVDAAGTTTVLHAAGPSRVRRDREPFALVVDAAALAALATDARALRSRQLIRDEATALVRLVLTRGERSATLERGAVIGEWTGAGALPAAAIDAAAAALADLRADHFGAGTAGLDLRLEATFEAAPVAGAQPATHTIELAAGGDCRARVDGAAVVLEPAACGALRALGAAVR